MKARGGGRLNRDPIRRADHHDRDLPNDRKMAAIAAAPCVFARPTVASASAKAAAKAPVSRPCDRDLEGKECV
jgi:hypothetical protein